MIPLGFDFKIFQRNIDENRKLFREKYSIKDEEIAIGIIGRLTAIKNQKYYTVGSIILMFVVLTSMYFILR